jgi:chromosome segregation ATPase
MNNKTLTESMSDLRQKLQLIENTTNEAATSAGEKAAEKFGLQTAASALKGTAAKARAKLAAATDKLPGGATRASKRAKLRKVKQHVASIKQHVRANELKAAAEAETNVATKAALEKQAQEATQEAERLSQAAGSIDREVAQAVAKEPEMVALQANNPEALQAAIEIFGSLKKFNKDFSDKIFLGWNTPPKLRQGEKLWNLLK